MVSLMLIVATASCTTTDVSPTTTEGQGQPHTAGTPSTTFRSIPFDTGIEGTMTRGGESEDASDLLRGQILVWGPREKQPPETTTTGITVPGRPREAVDVNDGTFAVELDPGWYRVKGTVVDVDGGEVCDELWVEVKSQELTTVEFVCD